MTPDIWGHLQRRAFDIAAITSKTLKVKLQGERIQIKSFENVKDNYKDTLIYEFSKHDPINGPLRSFDI